MFRTLKSNLLALSETTPQNKTPFDCVKNPSLEICKTQCMMNPKLRFCNEGIQRRTIIDFPESCYLKGESECLEYCLSHPTYEKCKDIEKRAIEHLMKQDSIF